MLYTEAQADKERELAAESKRLTQAVIDRANEQIKKNQALLDKLEAARKAKRAHASRLGILNAKVHLCLAQ